MTASDFRYCIEARSGAEADYVRHLLRSHGLAYPWDTRAASDALKGVRITVAVGSADGPHSEDIATEAILTGDERELAQLGLVVPSVVTRSALGYLVPVGDQGKATRGIPVPLRYARGFQRQSTDWKPMCWLLGGDRKPLVFAGTRIWEGTRRVVFGLDLVALLNERLLGPQHGPNGGLWEDWSVAYCEQIHQTLACRPFVDEILELIVRSLSGLPEQTFPLILDYYPPGKSAPLLITGDSDDCTPEQLEAYFSALEARDLRAAVFMKRFDIYPADRLGAARLRGHALGIHPYSESSTVKEFTESWRALLDLHHAISGDRVCGARNHKFQYLGRTVAVELEREAEVFFDLNCVAACGHTWIGSASGVGFPLAFPPLNGHFYQWPLHLPTVVEDDVFLFSHDYCYQAFRDGPSLATDTVVRFLSHWLLRERRPAAVNLHPEHVTTETRQLLDIVLEWAASHGIWTPTLRDFAEWLLLRDRTSIATQRRPEGTRALVSTETPVTLRTNLPSPGFPRGRQLVLLEPGQVEWTSN